MRYAEAIARLFAMESRGIRLGVSRMAAGLRYRGHPERGRAFIHVAGTNGKGSVATMLAAVLARAGYRTGLYTSPHLHRYVERVRIDGRPLSEREAAARISELLEAFAAPGAPDTTFFELTTLLAIEAFRDRDCDVVVLEVGLGGRLDATNAVPSVLAVITGIALDHTGILGDSVQAIAREKAGILERGVPAVLGVRDPAARAVITRRAARLKAPVWCIDRDFTAVPEAGERLSVRVGARVEHGLELRLLGDHQRDNAACAVAAIERLREQGFEVPGAALRAGLRAARSAGRLERVAGRPQWLFDAAHNAQGAVALARFLRERDPWLRTPKTRRAGRVLLFGCMRDKDHASMLAALLPLFDRVYFYAPPMRRAMSARQLAQRYCGSATRGLGDALARARRSAGEQGQVVVAGSIFLIGEVRARVLGLRRDPLIRM